jgi:hypothetical protein
MASKNDIVRNICKDINDKSWADLNFALRGYCLNTDQEFTRTYATLCLSQEKTEYYSEVPREELTLLKGKGQQLYSFIDDSENYLTFSAKSPVVLSWATTSENSNDNSEALDAQIETMFGNGIQGALNTPATKAETKGKVSFTNLKTQSKTEKFTTTHASGRTVTVTFDDGDTGMLTCCF